MFDIEFGLSVIFLKNPFLSEINEIETLFRLSDFDHLRAKGFAAVEGVMEDLFGALQLQS